MDTTAYDHDSQTTPHAATDQPEVERLETRRCESRLCSVGLMKAGCPTCLLLGLVMMPFEWAGRTIAGRLNKPHKSTSQLTGDQPFAADHTSWPKG